jgi:hypothetical protein
MKSQILQNIPKNKLDIELEKVDALQIDDIKKAALKKAYHRYYDSNIPIKYWFIEMDKHFKGFEGLLNNYKELTKDISLTYKVGKSLCFAGTYGIGKTLLCTNILKRAVEKGYSGIYTSLTDIVSAQKTFEAPHVRKELLTVDFLVIDEFDPRYMATDAASDFYGRVLEDIIRNRSQNKLPLFMCTNSPNPVMSFNGSLQQSIKSLMNYVELVPALGSDYRPKEILEDLNAGS